MTTAIWWLRRDLRLADNPALAHALSYAGRVVPVFILDDRLLNSPYSGARRISFLLEGLRRLNDDLRARGNRLIIRQWKPTRPAERRVNASRVFACNRIARPSPRGAIILWRNTYRSR